MSKSAVTDYTYGMECQNETLTFDRSERWRTPLPHHAPLKEAPVLLANIVAEGLLVKKQMKSLAERPFAIFREKRIRLLGSRLAHMTNLAEDLQSFAVQELDESI